MNDGIVLSAWVGLEVGNSVGCFDGSLVSRLVGSSLGISGVTLYLVGVGLEVGEELVTVEGAADMVLVGRVLEITVGPLLCETDGPEDNCCDGFVLSSALGVVDSHCEGLTLGVPLSMKTGIALGTGFVGRGVGTAVGRFVGPSLDVKVGF